MQNLGQMMTGGDPFHAITPSSYGVILADPPWSFSLYSKKGEKKSPQKYYGCMSLADIRALPVANLARKDCALIMWATAPMLPQAIETMDAWGFRFKSAGSWAKQSKTGQKWHFGTGYCFRSANEFFLLGTIGKPRQKVRNIRNLIVAPVREHSRKPDEMRRNIEALFAREAALGWDAWGDEAGKFQPFGRTV